MPDETFVHSEAGVLERLGLSRGEGRSIRNARLIEGLDWQKNGREIFYSESGLTKMSEGISSEPIVPLTVQHDRAATKKVFRVSMIPMNPRMVLAENGSGERVLVEVGRNGTFVVGDEIEAEKHGRQNGIWKLCSPVPRDKRRVPISFGMHR